MPRLTIAITAALLLCGAGALAGIAWRLPDLRAAPEFLLTLLLPLAFAFALALVILFVRRAISGTARPLFKVWWLWLVLVNGGIAAGIFWLVFLRRHGS